MATLLGKLVVKNCGLLSDDLYEHALAAAAIEFAVGEEKRNAEKLKI